VTDSIHCYDEWIKVEKACDDQSSSLSAATIVSRLGDRDVQTGDCWRSKLARDGILVDDHSALVSGLRLLHQSPR